MVQEPNPDHTFRMCVSDLEHLVEPVNRPLCMGVFDGEQRVNHCIIEGSPGGVTAFFYSRFCFGIRSSVQTALAVFVIVDPTLVHGTPSHLQGGHEVFPVACPKRIFHAHP
ncbi:hypothetical protein ES708_17496 [subsurface metagenome]